jgi:hypothetical protein
MLAKFPRGAGHEKLSSVQKLAIRLKLATIPRQLLKWVFGTALDLTQSDGRTALSPDKLPPTFGLNFERFGISKYSRICLRSTLSNRDILE